jgi:PEP-CTERM motif/Protein of unknown function (DUF642)
MTMYLKIALMTSALILSAPVSAANLLTNGSFEARIVTAADVTNPGGPWSVRDFASTPGWTQILDGVDLIHNNYAQGPSVLVDASDGVNFIDMNQTGLIGGLEQIVAAVTGQSYTLTLDTTAWATNAIGGTIGYELFDPTSAAILASGSYQDSVGGAWITRTLSAAATSTSIGVRIKAIQSTQAGMGLDNVRLTTVAIGAVPEPATWAMMLFGFGLVGSAMRRGRRSIALV